MVVSDKSIHTLNRGARKEHGEDAKPLSALSDSPLDGIGNFRVLPIGQSIIANQRNTTTGFGKTVLQLRHPLGARQKLLIVHPNLDTAALQARN